MKLFYKPLLLLAASAMLASCGGGGSGSSSAFTPPGTDTVITLSATTTTLPASPYTVGEEQDATEGYPGNFLDRRTLPMCRFAGATKTATSSRERAKQTSR